MAVLLKAYFSDFSVLLPHHMTSVDVKKKKIIRQQQFSLCFEVPQGDLTRRREGGKMGSESRNKKVGNSCLVL